MTIWWLVALIGFIVALGTAFIYLSLHFKSTGGSQNLLDDETINNTISHIFNDEFREELRNRGRLYFENVINENAMFLQQDLQLTTSQLNEYLKNEITQKLKIEFEKYEESINDAKQLAVSAIQKTNEAIDEQRQILSSEVQKQIIQEKNQSVIRFEKNMADIINHYVLSAIGHQIDLNDQLEYILSDLEANKKSIIEDIQNGS